MTDDEFLPEGQKPPGLLWCIAVYLPPLPPSSDDPLPGRTPLTFPPAPQTISKPPFPKAANLSQEKRSAGQVGEVIDWSNLVDMQRAHISLPR